MTTAVDAIVIGSGQAGVPLAVKLAGAGKRVVLAERGVLGGTCINTGCTPTKTMIASANAAHRARTAARLGVRVGPVSVDFSAVRRRKEELVEQWRNGAKRRIEHAAPNLALVQGHARFVAERTVEIGEQRFTAETVVIDVGARPLAPKLAGLDDVRWLDNRRLMELEQPPERLIVVGGGYVGCEFAQMFRRFGAEVTILEHGDHLMNREDTDVSLEIETVFASEGISMEFRSAIERVVSRGSGVSIHLSDGRELEGSHLLVATGRRPNTDDLGCENAGIRLDKHGYVVTGEHYETSAAGVYAVGDASGAPQFTHVAWDDHRILFEALMGRPTRARSSRFYPYVAFTDPEVAGVGLSEKGARARGVDYELATVPFSNVSRAIEEDERAGILKVLLDPKTERVLGACIAGARAGELIHCFAVLMEAGASARAIVDAEFAHPTLAEGVQSVVMALRRYSS